jgi:hypothetical protein
VGKKLKNQPATKTTRHEHRDGDTMVEVIVRTRPAVIDYADIREAVEVDADECMSDAPWENCDGFKHDLRDVRDDADLKSEACIYHQGSRQIIELTEDHGIYEYLRERGASRQTAREAVANDRRRTLDILKGWYRDGWEWWYVHCDYLDASAGVGGVDDYEYASEACADEIAGEVAHDLEKKGYTINGIPTEADRRTSYLENRRYHLRQNLLMGTWR